MIKKTAYIIFLDVQKAYDKAWLDGILHALHRNGVKGKNLTLIKKLNSNLRARIHTRHGLTREIKIKDSIRQGGVLSVIEYATLIDEIAKELKKNNIGLQTKQGTQLNTLLWMDDVCLIHHDLTTLQEMLDITNYVAKKYHIEFGAAKCKVVKIGPGQESKIMLNNTILEEVPKYKYLGKIYNTKGNLEEHLKDLETKTMAATQRILAETGDKEFKGMRMKAIWQCIEATIIPFLTYGSEAWNPTKKGRRTDTKDIQHNPENDHEPTPGNPYNNATEGIRIHTNQPWNKYKKNNASQKDWRKRRKLPNKR